MPSFHHQVRWWFEVQNDHNFDRVIQGKWFIWTMPSNTWQTWYSSQMFNTIFYFTPVIFWLQYVWFLVHLYVILIPNSGGKLTELIDYIFPLDQIGTDTRSYWTTFPPNHLLFNHLEGWCKGSSTFCQYENQVDERQVQAHSSTCWWCRPLIGWKCWSVISGWQWPHVINKKVK